MNRFRIGDRVLFLNEKGGGVICGFEKNLPIVRMDDGMEIAYPADQLVKTGYTSPVDFSGCMDENLRSVTKEEEVGVAWVPQSHPPDEHSTWSLYIINNTSMYLNYVFLMEHDPREYLFIDSSFCNPYHKKLVREFDFSQLINCNRYGLDIVFYRKDKSFIRMSPLSETLFVNEHTLKKDELKETPFFSVPCRFLLLKQWNESNRVRLHENDMQGRAQSGLSEEDISKLKNFKKLYTSSVQPSFPPVHSGNIRGTVQVDLHIEKISKDYRKMSNAEILQFQLNFFERKLNEAINDRYEKMLVIHGVGNGVLKRHIWKMVTEEYKMKIEESPDFSNKGGASLIYL